jgi:hypothetical protein
VTSEARKTIKRFGGATMLALVVGLGAGVGSAITATAMTPISTVMPAAPAAATPAGPAANAPAKVGDLSGVTLTACISGLNC